MIDLGLETSITPPAESVTPPNPETSPVAGEAGGGFRFTAETVRLGLELGKALMGRNDPVRRLEEVRARIELGRLEAEFANAHELEWGQALALLPRIVIVVGGQGAGKSTFAGALAWGRGPGRRCLWVEPEGSLPTVLPPWCERELTPVPTDRSDLYVDEAWGWFESGKTEPVEWLRRLRHADGRVVLLSQSGAFLKPAIWRSGDVAIVHVGGDYVGEAFEREEITELMARLSRVAKPRELAALYVKGNVFSCRYPCPHKDWLEAV